MPLFRYEVADSHGQTLFGVMSAPNETELRTRLEERGFRVLAVYPPEGDAGAPARAPRLRASPEAKAIFFRQLASLIRAGISPYAALEDLATRLTDPAMKQACASMRDSVHEGHTLSQAMAVYPSLFPLHVVATVQAGETGGFLEIAVDEIGLEYEQETAFYKGTWLPKALVMQELFALALVQPLFPTLFPNNQLSTYLSLVFLRNVPICIVIILAVRWLWGRMHTPGMSERKDRWTLGLPVFGDLSRQRSLAAFIRMLRRLYAAGLMPIHAWEGASRVVPNSILRAKLAEAQAMIEKGVPLHEAFRATGLFASEAEQLLATGVVSGQVVEMLDRVAEYYQRNVEHAFEQSRFWMFRLAFALFLLLSGAVLILLVKSYFDAVFNFTKDWV